MQCREFREISDSYINDELLVETNHQVDHHIEHCPECRADFAMRQALRRRLKVVVRNADQFKIDPNFTVRMRSDLRKEALRNPFWQNILFRPSIFVPAMASILLAVVLGIVFINSDRDGNLFVYNSAPTGLVEIASYAANEHQHCALEKLGTWLDKSETDYPQKAEYTEKILRPLQAQFSDKIEMLSIHNCVYKGKEFQHVVLRSGKNIVSVFFDRSDLMKAPGTAPDNSIISNVESGLQVASFIKSQQAIFVVSDLSEMDNMNVARTVSQSWTL